MEIQKDDAHKALYGERFLRLAEEGKRLPIMDAMRSLVRAYMKECGLSETWATLYYCAAEGWQEDLAASDLPLADKAREDPLIFFIREICDEYDPELYDEYDISWFSKNEFVEYTVGLVDLIERSDPSLAGALCYGIYVICEMLR